MGTSLRRRRGAACAAAALSALVLSACLPGDGGDEESTGGATSSSSTEAEPSGGTGEGGGDAPTPYEADEFTEPQQRELTSKEAKAALPTVKDMPDKHYKQDVSDNGTSDPYTYDPKKCAAIEFASDGAVAFADEHRTTLEYARFFQPRSAGGDFLGVWIHSYDEPYPLAYFDEAGSALSSCAEFVATSPKGHDFGRKTQAISAPTIDGAERVFAVRIVGDRVNTDRLYVRSGHNRIVVMQQRAGDEPFDERLLTKHAKAVLADLKKGS